MMLARSVSDAFATTSAAVGPSLAHPHVERTVEPEREAALGLIELHRGNADIHHDAVDRVERPARRRLRPDWRTGPRPGSAGRPSRSTRSNPPAIAVRSRSMPITRRCRRRRGSRGCSRRRRRSRRHRRRRRAARAISTASRPSTEIWRAEAGHARAPGAGRRRKWKLDADGPMAPQISALCRAFPAEKPPTHASTRCSPPQAANPDFRRNWLGCHGISSVKEGLASPKTGSALHHSVTAFSLKKALTVRRGFCALFNDAPSRQPGDASRTHSAKMRQPRQLPGLPRQHRKGIVNVRLFVCRSPARFELS